MHSKPSLNISDGTEGRRRFATEKRLGEKKGEFSGAIEEVANDMLGKDWLTAGVRT
jgi:hypothetical protein